MTRERAKQLLPIIAAFAEGKTIQHKSDINAWIDGTAFSFDDPADKYRIKPETKLRPFKRGEIKCGDVVKAKDGSCEYMIFGTSNESVWIHGTFKPYAYLFEFYTMLDGSPCGKEAEE